MELPLQSTGSQRQSQTEQKPGESGSEAPETSEIDLQTLAERVLKLLKDEARIERERQGSRHL